MALQDIRTAIAPLRHALLNHSVYEALRDPDALRSFMSRHVFAVWDFMSLLKALQQRVCCVAVPWLPPADGEACRLVNEIVLAEESDEDGAGGHAGHFELYRRAMAEFGADAAGIDAFLAALREDRPVRGALRAAGVDAAVRRFVTHTFDEIAAGDPCRIAAAFTFGREDLLPGVFGRIVEETARREGNLSTFNYYLKRHIDLDGDEHGPAAERLVAALCGDDPEKWQAAQQSAVAALQARLDLWDGIDSLLRDAAAPARA